MPKLIKNHQIIDDQWILIKESSHLEDLLAYSGQDLIVPLAFWREDRNRILQRSDKTAVWLNSHEVPKSLEADLDDIEVIALNFPIFSDGRPYTSARELRSNLGYKGEIRAIGDVLRDQLFYMSRCGFDAFLMREDQNLEEALSAFDDFTDGYQVSVDKPIPLFRRR